MPASLYELVESRASLPLLCYLIANGPSTIYQLVQGLKFGRDAVEHAVLVTAALGPCREERSTAFPFSRNVSLTPKGLLFMRTPLCEFPAFLWNGPRPAPGDDRSKGNKKAAAHNATTR